MRILIAVGGSGGHLFPAEQFANELTQKGDEVLFAGCGLKKSALFKRGVSFVDIFAAPLSRPIQFFIAGTMGLFQSIRCILRFKPDRVVGFGSYHTFPVLLGAVLLRKKIVLFEANTVLGKVNRLFSRFATVTGQFPLSKTTTLVQMLPWGLKRNPVSKEEADRHYKLDKRFTILVFGGSQGAKFFNEIMPLVAPKLDANFIHLSGKGKRVSYSPHNREFEENMERAYRASDMVISRSGASTIGELIFHRKPALLIPFPFAAENHQEKNALFFSDVVKGGRCLKESLATPQKIIDEIQYIQKNLETLKGAIASFNEETRPSLSEVL